MSSVRQLEYHCRRGKGDHEAHCRSFQSGAAGGCGPEGKPTGINGHRGAGQGAGRRSGAGYDGAAGGQSGHRQEHIAAADGPQSNPAGNGPVCQRGGKQEPDPFAGRPTGHPRGYAAAVRNQCRGSLSRMGRFSMPLIMPISSGVLHSAAAARGRRGRRAEAARLHS